MSSEGTSPRSPSIRSSFSLGNEVPMELSSERVKEIRKDYITRHKEVSSILFGIENSPTSNQQPFIASVAPGRNKSKIQSQGIPLTPTSDKLRPEGLCQEARPISPSNQKNFLSSFWDSIVDSVSSPIAIFQSTDPDSTEKDDQSTDKGLEGYRDAVEEEFEDDLSTIATIEVYYSEGNGKDINEFDRRLALQTERRCTDSASVISLDDGDQDFYNSLSGPEETKTPTVRGGGRSKIPPADSISPICMKSTSNNGTSMRGDAKAVLIKSDTVVECDVTIDEAAPSKIKSMVNCEPPVPVSGMVSSLIRTMESNKPSLSGNINTKLNFEAAMSEPTVLVTDSKATPIPVLVPVSASVSTISNIYSAETVEKIKKKRRPKGQERHSEEGLKAVEVANTGTLDVSTHLDTPSLLVELRAWRDIELEADESFIRGLRQTRKDLEDRLELIRIKEE
jgi:hypothetical protein